MSHVCRDSDQVRHGRARRAPGQLASVLSGAVLLDLALGEPTNRYHPVAWLGRLASSLEQRAPRQGRAARLGYGLALTVLLVGGSAVAGGLVERLARAVPAGARPPLLALALAPSFSLRALAQAALLVEQRLALGDLDAARDALRALVSRPTEQLDLELVASAAIESVAENLADSVVAPLLAFLLGGLPAAYAYRAANTLDAMIGYHGQYEDLGKVAARLDDLLNLAPSRVSALLLVGAAGLGAANGQCALATLGRDRGRTASPNAGWPMSAMAGALGVRLEKPGAYVLGGGHRPPDGSDIRRAVRLYWLASGLGLIAAFGWLLRRGSIERRGSR